MAASGMATLASLVPGASYAAAKRPNILFIITDQQPVSTMGCYGNALDPTPHADRLAKGGVRFDAFHIAAFACSPSRASFYTGRYSHTHGVVNNDVLLDPAIPTLGTITRDAGYDTAFYGKSHLSGKMYRRPVKGADDNVTNEWYYRRVEDDKRFTFERAPGGVGEDATQMGFTDWAGGWKQFHDYLRSVGLADLLGGDPPRVGNHNDAPSGPEGTHIYSKIPEDHHMAAFFRKKAVEFLGAHPRGASPFCMVVSFYGPHLPVAPPKPWDEKYSLDQVSLPDNLRDDMKGKPKRQSNDTRKYVLGKWSDEQLLDYIRRYYGYSAYIDAQVGMILDALEASGQADDTIVVFTSDHGDMITAHGHIYKMATCGYDELLRVPFILRYPRLDQGGRSNKALVSSVDTLATLLDLAELPLPKGQQGRSFRPLLTGKTSTFRDHVICNSGGRNLTVTDGAWKYVANWSPPRDIDELYDMKADPGEMVNLIDDKRHTGQVKRLQGLIADWLRDTGHPYAEHVIEEMMKKPEKAAGLEPSIVEIKLLDGDKIELTYQWELDVFNGSKKPQRPFCQFINAKYAKDGAIAFRHADWVTPDTTTWRAGETRTIGPVTIKIPKTCGSGAYEVRIGLFDSKREERISFGGGNNYVTVGTLTLRKENGAISSVAYESVKN